MHPIVLLATAALTAATPSFHWHGQVPTGRAVEIRGTTGDIRAVPSETSEVQVFATIHDGQEQEPATIRVDEHAAGLTVCAVRANTVNCPDADDALAAPHARINYLVKLPAGVHFSGRTVDGRIEADSLASNVSAYTINGPVVISTSGTAQARTVNGSIYANLLKPFWAKPAELSTVNGAITLRIPTGVSAPVQAETRNGRVVADAPFQGSATEQTLRGKIGNGGVGNRVLLRSINGSIEIRQDY